MLLHSLHLKIIGDHNHACNMPHDARRLLLVLFVVSLNHVVANSTRSLGPSHEHPRRLLHHIPVPSVSSSSEVTGSVSKQAAASAQGVDRIAHVSFLFELHVCFKC